MRINVSLKSLAGGLIGLLALAAVGCSKPATEETVASVNGESISLKAYLAHLERKPRVQVLTNQGVQEANVAGTLGLQALRDLVQQKVILQLAKEDNVLPSDADVKAELDFQNEQQGNIVQSLTAQGITLDAIKNDILVNLARERLMTKGITVSMQEVDTFIKENAQSFMEPERASIQWIVLSDATKKALVDKDLSTGQDFRTVAIRYSEAPGARQSGGAYQTDVVPQMPQALQQIVKNTPEAKTTQWYQDGKNWVKFYVQKKTPAKKMEMTETRKKMVQRQLALQRGSAANDLNKRISDKLRAAKIDVTPKNLKEPWERIFEQEKNEMAQQASSPAAGGAAGTAAGAATGAGTANTAGAAPKGG